MSEFRKSFSDDYPVSDRPASPATGFRFWTTTGDLRDMQKDEEDYARAKKSAKGAEWLADEENPVVSYYALPLTPDGTVAPEVVERVARALHDLAERWHCEMHPEQSPMAWVDDNCDRGMRMEQARAALSALVQGKTK